MIPVDTLRAVRKIIVHKQSDVSPCGDGRASALILHAALPGAEVIELAYGEPAHVNLAAEPGLLFCDFSPPEARAAEFVKAGAIVLDHHERERVEPFGALGVFGENAHGESGAWLAWREVYQAITWSIGEARAADRIAALAAIRDTWQRDSPEWDAACAMTAALVFVPLPDMLAMGVERFAKLAAGGRGVPISPDVCDAWGMTIRGQFGDAVGLGFAGGLDADHLPRLAAEVRSFGASIDAEGRLRDGDEGGTLNLDKVRAYLAAAGEVMSGTWT